MIAAIPGLFAVYAGQATKRVEAWDDKGYPMVIGPDHRLIQARRAGKLLGIKS